MVSNTRGLLQAHDAIKRGMRLCCASLNPLSETAKILETCNWMMTKREGSQSYHVCVGPRSARSRSSKELGRNSDFFEFLDEVSSEKLLQF